MDFTHCRSIALVLVGVLSFLPAVVASGASARAEDIAPTTRASLAAEAKNPRPIGGDAIILLVRIENVSKDDIEFIDTWAERDFQVSVTDEKGRAVPKTSFGREEPPDELHIISRIPMKLQPHERLVYALAPNLFYDMTSPGVYLVTVRRSIRLLRPKSEPMKLSSEPVKVTVLERRTGPIDVESGGGEGSRKRR